MFLDKTSHFDIQHNFSMLFLLKQLLVWDVSVTIQYVIHKTKKLKNENHKFFNPVLVFMSCVHI